LAVKLADKKAATMTQQTTKAFRKVPRILRHTLTVDNGKEFADFKELETKKISKSFSLILTLPGKGN
jgi:IS30 family transposase